MKVFDNSQLETYKAEVQERWGNTDAYKEHEEKTKGYSKDKWNNTIAGLDGIFADFTLCMKNGNAPDSEDAKEIVKKLQNHITQNFYTCTNDILAGLGQMYVCDERFKNNIDQHGEGTALFASEAIACYCRK